MGGEINIERAERKEYMKILKLKPIDLRKTGSVGGGDCSCSHPDISSRKWYLIQYDSLPYIGHFEWLWYGWNFDGVYDVGVQLNYPELERVWEITNWRKC